MTEIAAPSMAPVPGMRRPGWSLPRRFALTGGLIMLAAMLAAGQFTARMASRAAIGDSAVASAMFLDSFLAPLAQSLAGRDDLPAEAVAALDRLLDPKSFAERFPHVEIWKAGGLVVYSRAPALIGRRFAPPDGLRAALDGVVSAQYADLRAGEHVLRGFRQPFLEIYVPIREQNSGRIIAVAEIHEVTAQLEEKLSQVRLYSWLTVFATAGIVMLGLFGVVYRASRVIDAQHADLRRRMAEIERISRQNAALKQKAQRASGRIVELTESQLRRIGADLHDGPTQLIGLAALMVEHVRRASGRPGREAALRKLALALDDAMRDIRAISKGLMAPEIEHLPLAEVVDRAVRNHRQRTGTDVAVRCSAGAAPLSHAVKSCVYRFIQEGLNNAFRHAGGAGQQVDCALAGPVLTVVVRSGAGAGAAERTIEPGLGLHGLRERVESLGGVFRFRQAAGEGTAMEMTLALPGEADDA